MDGGDVLSFAIRLGYDPIQVRRLVDRMGADITQNELLSELVKIKGSLDVRSGDDVGGEAPDLRHVVVDGANIISNYDGKESYRLPIRICVEWFKTRGHKDITVFIPSSWREFYFSGKEKDSSPKLEEIMYTPEEDKTVWSKAAILKFVLQVDGILVSNDNYEKLVKEFPEYLAVVEKRLLMYSFAKNRFMPPDDPLGRMGPVLDKFLQKSDSLQPSGTKNQTKSAKGNLKGQRSISPKYAKRTLSRLNYAKRKSVLPNELIRSNSDQTIKYGSLPSITEAPVTDLLQNISLETSSCDSRFQLHQPVVKNASDPTSIEIKCHVTTSSLTPPGSSNGSLLKHQKVGRKSYDFNRLAQDAIYWRSQPAERPFEDIKSNDILRSHFSVPDISFGAVNDSQNFYNSSSNCYSSAPNFWTNAFGEGQLSYNPNNSYVANLQSVYAARAKIHYHMSAIFPQEQVDTVFRLHPDEINPRQLCSEIIRLFPNV